MGKVKFSERDLILFVDWKKMLPLILGIYFLYSSETMSEPNSFRWKDGEIVVNGKAYNRQIYFRHKKLSHFANWENIEKLFLSPDKKSLVVYHRADKEKFYRLTLFRFETRNHTLVRSIQPGMACHDLFWYRDKIIFKTGTTGGGTYLTYYDKNLKKINEINSYHFYVDRSLGIALASPVYGPDDGKFWIYSLYSGKIIETFDYKKEMNENYTITDLKKIGAHKFMIRISGYHTERTKTFIKNIPKMR
ncbi:hypothetical protein GS518_07870 [Leptospira interrogans]|uniref:Uncharacterized protein n=2 Tax=Leptospira interrogans TaxID=173 RepID=Q72S06_LEPIC|nr:hypothetical protein [Leptospira interrogans]OCC29234.1 Uncharacterized protein GNX_2187 [Leptospira interrogans serovar Canicola]AAS70177.1 conserved hypothetical protein [Leptospira interrogans serovar Copenhageni str. Fiocruz L1-130]ARB97507.1 hypothetical protein A6J42_20435 [Leptospira interrogans serovar Copenhageni]ASP42132.1 hypothetical protein AMR47_11110 [Leptospira interrogans]KAA5550866.1 hypothetical protein F3G11_10200 [Leptospira interrogans serovar Copenhageni]